MLLKNIKMVWQARLLFYAANASAENTIKTSKEHRCGACGPFTVDVNTRAALGCLHAARSGQHPFQQFTFNPQCACNELINF